MADKHTSGPWRVSDANPKIVIEDRLPFYSEGRIVAKVSSYPDSGFFFSDEEAVDHARLIAAAPELLSTAVAQHRVIDHLLAWIIDRHPDFYPTKSPFWPLIQEANAVQVIAKARGEQV